MTITHPLHGRTCEATADPEVNGLHALGKVHLPDIPCEKKGRMEGEENEKTRNEGRTAAEPQPQKSKLK